MDVDEVPQDGGRRLPSSGPGADEGHGAEVLRRVRDRVQPPADAQGIVPREELRRDRRAVAVVAGDEPQPPASPPSPPSPPPRPHPPGGRRGGGGPAPCWGGS